jgi:hypothetical protein
MGPGEHCWSCRCNRCSFLSDAKAAYALRSTHSETMEGLVVIRSLEHIMLFCIMKKSAHTASSTTPAFALMSVAAGIITVACLARGLSLATSSLAKHVLFIYSMVQIMRLVNTETLQMEEFVHPPSYATLSHCWGENEVNFKECSKGKNKNGTGDKKINECCDFVRRRGQDWVWMDTCCINKRSGAELKRSYQFNVSVVRDEGASECYAYIADVSSAVAALNDFVFKYYLEKSRWFTRGWTLQELIAPDLVVFLASEWTILGEKRILPLLPRHARYPTEQLVATPFFRIIVDITALPIHLLRGRKPNLSDFPAVLRLSWLSERDTTRSEDLAYCMLGLLEINIPLLYGEGRAKAFRRIQLEVLRLSGDDSLSVVRIPTAAPTI